MIDLSNLEAGDTAKIGCGTVCFVTLSKHFIDDIFTVSADPQKEGYHFFTGLFHKNGVSKVASNIPSNNIIEIIKNPKRWTDEDMIKAFIASSWNEISCDPLTAEQWLEQYKVVKNG